MQLETQIQNLRHHIHSLSHLQRILMLLLLYF
nr:MAG TPA: hypothetical protein [Caudoviricetes sp.]